jgi:hypothetical protein
VSVFLLLFLLVQAIAFFLFPILFPDLNFSFYKTSSLFLSLFSFNPFFFLKMYFSSLRFSLWFSVQICLFYNVIASGTILFSSINLPYVTEVIRTYAKKHKNRTAQNDNQLIRDLFTQPEIGRRLNRMWPEDLIR